ncbi:MAG: alternative ribosome rescue aminoacyl-tRNA hydrolase ArfB [Bacteroidales bacterium]|nr:alternative ribosome rescue aminoacyl-tRNA hydrolase ArfB [Bacteroidales bacterium]
MRDCLAGEVQYRSSRSSGPGGQHVNKTESRVELRWCPYESACLNEAQIKVVVARLAKRITREGVLILVSEKYRSQFRNKADVTERFINLVHASLVPVKKRRPTQPSRSGMEKRIRSKKIRGEIKRLRRMGPEE